MAMRAVTVNKQGVDFKFAVHKRLDADTCVVSVTRTDILHRVATGHREPVATIVDYIRCKRTSDLRRVANRWLGGGR